MLARVLRLLGWFSVGALVVWWGRLRAHSKLPPAEGRWREVSEDTLT